MTIARASESDDPGLAAKVAFLSRPESFAEPSRTVATVETHMSWVFLLDRHAYKLKKPVRLPYLDFSTEALRRAACADEVRLNRRLATDVYLAAVPLTASADHALAIEGEGRIVDWLVRMRRLPADRMLDRMIAARTLTADDVRRVVGRLAAFYRACVPIPIPAETYLQRFAEGIAENRRELTRPAYGLAADRVKDVCDRQQAALDRHAEALAARARAGRIVEAHGDLRPEHVCIEAEPQVIDCLEFSRELRCLDPVDELGFLTLECERLAAGWVHARAFAAYAEATADAPPPALVAFYQSYRATVRAKIAAWHLNDDGVRAPATWTDRATGYIALARAKLAACG
jgi:aminoglycoside phosphotransferase family enzyme